MFLAPEDDSETTPCFRPKGTPAYMSQLKQDEALHVVMQMPLGRRQGPEHPEYPNRDNTIKTLDPKKSSETKERTHTRRKDV